MARVCSRRVSDPPRSVVAAVATGAAVAAEYAAESGGRHPLALLSGGLLGSTVDPESYDGEIDGAPGFVAGGGDDERVPAERLAASARTFGALGGDVISRAYEGVGHEVTDDEFAWLANRLAKRLTD
jgi:phospholipase/carboxylesterase